MRALTVLSAGLILVVCGGTAAPGPKDAPKPDPNLLGRWKLVRSFYGKTETTAEAGNVEYEFTGDGAWIMRLDGKDYVGGPGKFTTDTTTSPIQIDLIRDPGDPTNRAVTQGIYKIDGDTLTMRKPERGQGRPDSFDVPEKGFLSIYKRVKKD